MDTLNLKKTDKTDVISISGLWLGRIVLTFVTFLFIMIGLRGIINPVTTSAQFGISPTSATAITVLRVSLGGFSLAIAIATLFCLVIPKKLLDGLILCAIVAWVLTIVRIYGLAIDGITEWNMKILRPEIVISILSSVSILLELRRRKRMSAS